MPCPSRHNEKCIDRPVKIKKDLRVRKNLCVKGSASIRQDLFVGGNISGKTLFIEDIVLTNNKCQEVVVTKSTHPLVGWWLNVNKGATSSTDVLWKIRCEDGNLFAHIYAGYQGRYREWTPEEAINADGGLWGLWDYTLPVNDFPLVPIESNPKGFYCNPTLPDDPEFLSKQQITAAQLNMTDDPNVCYTYMIGMQSPVGFGAYGGDTLKLVRLDYEPVIEKYNNPAYIDTTNPVRIFEDIFNTFYKIGNNQFTKEAQTKDYPGFAAMNQRYHELLTTGVTYTNTVKDVWRSRTDNPTGFVLPISTTLVVEDFPNARVGARLQIEGFVGAYDKVNNLEDGWELGISDNNNGRVAASALGSEYYDGANEKFLLTFLDLDTSDLPPYDPAIHGIGKTKLVIKPVTPATEYSELVAAVHDLYSFTGRHTHKIFRPYRDRSTFRIYRTFQDLQNGLNTNSAVRVVIRARGRVVTRASANYVDYSYISGSTLTAIPSNDPTGINLNDPKFEHSIDINNYYDPENTYNIYWALDGPEIPGSPVTGQRLLDVSESLIGPYYKNPGSKFIFTVSKFGEAPEDPKWSIYGDYEPVLLFGLLNTEKTCGEKVGFISLLDNFGIDSSFWASLFEDFSPGVPSSMGPLGDCFATVMEKINSFGVDKLIIDDRGNIGGLETVVAALASFIGGKRPSISYVIGFADNGNQPFERLQTIENRADFIGMQNFIDNSATLYNDLFAEKYPNSMFKGTAEKPKKVIFLTDSNAASAGDDNPHYFRNTLADDPSDLGDYVYCDIVGDIDGRSISGNTYPLSQFTNVSHNLMRNGNAVSAILVGLEGSAATAFIVKDGEIEYGSNQLPSIKPKVLLNGDIEATFWLDTGYKGTYPLNPIDGGTDPLVLPLSTGVTQPNKDDPTTWRDRFLEAAITSLVDCSQELRIVETLEKKNVRISKIGKTANLRKDEEEIKGPTRRFRV